MGKMRVGPWLTTGYHQWVRVELPVECLWAARWLPVGCLWAARGLPIGCLWAAHGLLVARYVLGDSSKRQIM